MKRFFSQFSIAKRGHNESCYDVNRDGSLVLNREDLLKSGRMKRQLDAARDLRALYLAAEKDRSTK
ncbi:hypothetical protein [Stenotrophomonas sp. AB1(2024)]|uniref:hypothetical protein n=1 Tax=Stenotrophomonas sp. AB1(2024) TaxID=3132215 RepID=UPI00309A4553